MPSATTRLGRLPLEIQRLAFGCEQLGGHDWGAVDVAAIESAIEVALAHGVRLFDTADCYGLGESERRLGRALRTHHERALIATKFGVRFASDGRVYHDSRPAWIETALSESLQRLGSERIDLYQMHYWDRVTPLATVFECLERERERGRIFSYGVSNTTLEGVDCATYPGLVSVSLEYSLVNRAHEALASAFAQRELTFIAYGSLGQGVLSGKYGPGYDFPPDDRRSRAAYVNFHGARYAHNLRIVARLRHWAAELDASLPELALAWIFARLPASIALVGIKRPGQMREALAALALQMPAAAMADLDAVSAASVA